MGFGIKLTFAFLAIILAMVLSQAGFSLILEYSGAKDRPRKVITPALVSVYNEVTTLYRENGRLGAALDNDPAFKQAFYSRNRAGVAQAVKSVIDRFGFPGYVTVILEDGLVFYSSDSPAKFGYRTDEANKPAVSKALGGKAVNCTCTPSITKNLALATIVPIHSGYNIVGVIAVNLPVDGALLAGLQTKAKLANSDNKDFELALYSMPDRAVLAASQALGNAKDSQYLAALNQQGEKIIHGDEFEFKGRLWKPTPLFAPDGEHAAALIYATSALSETMPKTMLIFGQVGIGALVGIILALIFSAGLSKRFNQSMYFMKQRIMDLASNRQDIPSLNGLSNEWMELGEMMDTAVSAPRTQILNLRQQVTKHEEELAEKKRQVEAMNYQLENVNRQLAAHNRQTAEVSKQISGANFQAVAVQQKLSSVLQVSTEGFLLLDPFGTVLSANPTFLNWVGLPERDIVGRHCFDLVKKPGVGPDQQDSQLFAKPQGAPPDLISQFYPEGVVYKNSSDKSVEVLIHLQPVMLDDTNIESYIMVMRDKTVHSELSRLRNEIVDMLTTAIRSPLALAEPQWKSILSSKLQNANPVLAQSLVELHKVYQQLLGVVDSYLMMYGGFVPAEMIPREQVAITRLVGECMEQVAPEARSHQIMLDYKTVTGLPTTSINKEIVRDVISQLLTKMIAVTAPGGRVRAETTVKDKDIRLSISSSGPALPQEEIEDMFVGFIEDKHSDDTYQSRLSMYLARNNAERIGGRLWAESEAGRGTMIYLTLPVH